MAILIQWYLQLPERGHVYCSQWTGWWLDVGDQCSHRGAGPHRGGSGGRGGKYSTRFQMYCKLNSVLQKKPMWGHNWSYQSAISRAPMVVLCLYEYTKYQSIVVTNNTVISPFDFVSWQMSVSDILLGPGGGSTWGKSVSYYTLISLFSALYLIAEQQCVLLYLYF